MQLHYKISLEGFLYVRVYVKYSKILKNIFNIKFLNFYKSFSLEKYINYGAKKTNSNFFIINVVF